MHELAHLARGDCTWNLIARIARAVMFFQPLLWVLVRRIEDVSDDVADDYVVQQGIDRRSYAHELVAIAERYRPSPSEAMAGAGVVSFKSSLGRRVQRILDTTRVLSICIGARAGAAIVAVGLCATLAAGLIGAEGGNPADDSANTRINIKVTEASASAPKSIADIKPPFTFRIHTVTPEGKPQPGVRIRCLHPRQERGKALVDVVGESDEKGIAEFHVTAGDLMRDRYYWFSLADDQFVGGLGVGISPVDDEYEFTFQVASTEEFKFLVYDENGKPVPNARLELTTNDRRIYYPRKTTHADHEGQATVRLASAETYIIAMAENYASTFIREAHLSTGKPYEIKLTAGFTITGKVVDQQGAGLSPARIEARKADFPQLCDDESLLRGLTDAAGEFQLKHASAGTHEVRAHVDDPNKPLFAEPVSVRVGDDTPRAHLIIQAKPGAVLKGRYFVKRDLGIANRPIHVYTFKPSYTHWHAQTAADGTFFIHIPSDAEGDIQFLGQSGYFNFVKLMKPYPFLSVQDYYDIRYKHVPPGIYDGIEVHLTLTGVARGTVLDDSGKPLANLAVVVSPHGGILRTGRDGKYWAAVPADQEAWLEVRDSSGGGTILKTAPFKVQEGEIVEKNITVPKRPGLPQGWKIEILPGLWGKLLDAARDGITEAKDDNR